jgi:hypothetical protein
LQVWQDIRFGHPASVGKHGETAMTISAHIGQLERIAQGHNMRLWLSRDFKSCVIILRKQLVIDRLIKNQSK